MIKINIKPEKRWDVVYETSNWRVGIYVPENTSINDVNYLEKHDKPELFYLVKGKIVLVLSSDGKEIKEVEMEKDKIYIVTEWHNAYRPDGAEGIALVIEAPDINTEYMKFSN